MKKKCFKFLSIGLIVLILIFMCTWKLSRSRTFQFFGEIIPNVDTDKKVVALTFDDGPTKENTDKIINILREVDVKATFYVIGNNLEQNLDEGKKLVADGHELGNHTYLHKRMVFKSPSFIKNEIETTDKFIRQAGYSGNITFRPPNAKKLLGLPYYLKQNNRKTIMWNLEPDSIAEIRDSSDKIINYVNENIKPGSIILMHVMYDTRGESINSVKGIVTSLKSKGYEFVTVSQLLEETK